VKSGRLTSWAGGLLHGLKPTSQQRSLAYFALGMAFITSSITALNSPIAMVAQANAAAAWCWPLLMLALRLGLHAQYACHIATTIATLEILVVAWYSGGIYSSALSWMAVLITANFFIVGTRVALYWFALHVAGFAFMVSSDAILGIGPALQSVSLAQSAISLLDNTLVFVVIMFVTLMYRQLDIKVVRDLHQQQNDLQKQRSELERVMAARDQFIAAVNHEVKPPLRVIADMSDAMLTGGEHPPEVTMVLEYSNTTAARVSATVADLLDYTRLQSGQLQVRAEPLQLQVELHTAYAALQSQKKSPGVRCALEIDNALHAPLHTDKALLALCLQKLMDNACRATRSGHITLAAHRSGNDAVILSVEDSGHGMSPAVQDRLNHQIRTGAPSMRKGQTGAGLGLLVVQGLTHMLGGTLGFESTAYHGSRFWIRLPLQHLAHGDSASAVVKG
jgi:signal transduction histidine kinase